MQLPGGSRWLALAALVTVLGAGVSAQELVRSEARFTAGVELFTLSVVVRDRDGRLVANLRKSDFEVFDRGIARPVVEFRVEPQPVSVALLFDTSGSMDVSNKLGRARDAAFQLLGFLDQAGDEVALYAFDTALRELRPFGPAAPGGLDEVLTALQPFGATSLRDAIAAAARRVSARAGADKRHRAVVVLTDGVDTSSEMTAAEVSAAASMIDVPVYVLRTVPRVDHPGEERGADAVFDRAGGELADLARWTGGALFSASRPVHFHRAAQEIVAELRQQYWMAVEPDREPGWHPLEVRTRDRGHTVRARSGYVLEETKVDR